MTSKITIFDHFARRLIDFSDIPTTPRSWVLNGYGKCEFSIGFDFTRPQGEQLLQEKYLQYGNLIHIEHIPSQREDGAYNGILPPWTGIILPPRQWDLGVCHITAFSAEAILSFRAMPYQQIKGTPKTIAREIVRMVNERANNIRFSPGVLDDSALTLQDDLRTNAFDHLAKLAKNAGMDWDVTGQINDKGNLELFVNLYGRKGVNTTLRLSNLNTEASGALLTEQGAISNQVFGYSHAQTAASRYTVKETDPAALDDYGPLQLNQVYLGVHDYAATQTATKTRVEQRARPVRTVNRTAIDYRDTFSFLDTGNTVTVTETQAGFHPNGGYGFESSAVIESVSYNDLSSRAVLNLRVLE